MDLGMGTRPLNGSPTHLSEITSVSLTGSLGSGDLVGSSGTSSSLEGGGLLGSSDLLVSVCPLVSAYSQIPIFPPSTCLQTRLVSLVSNSNHYSGSLSPSTVLVHGR